MCTFGLEILSVKQCVKQARNNTVYQARRFLDQVNERNGWGANRFEQLYAFEKELRPLAELLEVYRSAFFPIVTLGD